VLSGHSRAPMSQRPCAIPQVSSKLLLDVPRNNGLELIWLRQRDMRLRKRITGAVWPPGSGD
jgi:hypothetical protein